MEIPFIPCSSVSIVKFEQINAGWVWFSVASAATVAHKNHLFRLYQQNKSSVSKVKFGQTYTNKSPETWLSQLLANY